jgi:hypothetical protein
MEARVRKDMFKVIVERPRRGADLRVNRSRLAGEDDLPSRVGMKRFRTLNRTNSKWLNENLAPLKRYLVKQAGRPWSKVFSEICENLDTDNTVKQHVRDHLQDFVVTKVAIGRDGEWLNGNERSGGRMSDAPWRQPLYVDPRDGILKRSDKLWKKMRIDPTPHWRKRRGDPYAADPNVRRIDGNTELHCIGGIWYEIKFRKRTTAKPTDFTYDKLTHQPVWPGKRHAYSKEQLSAAALTTHSLQNSFEA